MTLALIDIVPFSKLTTTDRRQLNGDLTGATKSTMTALIGHTRGWYDQKCRKVENASIAHLFATRDVGPFKATGLIPALEALTAIFADIRAEKPRVHALLGNMGMLCCRLVRGSKSAVSNHAWGTAIDLTIGGVLDKRGDDMTQVALFEIFPIFNRHGFFWGAAFKTEDAMHFEASDQLVREWAAKGLLGPATSAPSGALAFGDRGPAVEALQAALNAALAPLKIKPDGIFGKDTRAMVVEYQRRTGLPQSGNADMATLKPLRLA